MEETSLILLQQVKIYLLWPESCREAMKMKLQYFSRIPADRLGRAEFPKARSGDVQSKVILEKICDNSIFKAVLKGFNKICVCSRAARRVRPRAASGRVPRSVWRARVA